MVAASVSLKLWTPSPMTSSWGGVGWMSGHQDGSRRKVRAQRGVIRVQLQACSYWCSPGVRTESSLVQHLAAIRRDLHRLESWVRGSK